MTKRKTHKGVVKRGRSWKKKLGKGKNTIQAINGVDFVGTKQQRVYLPHLNELPSE